MHNPALSLWATSPLFLCADTVPAVHLAAKQNLGSYRVPHQQHGSSSFKRATRGATVPPLYLPQLPVPQELARESLEDVPVEYACCTSGQSPTARGIAAQVLTARSTQQSTALASRHAAVTVTQKVDQKRSIIRQQGPAGFIPRSSSLQVAAATAANSLNTQYCKFKYLNSKQ